MVVWASISINLCRDDAGVVAAKERGGRLLKALTEEDSPAVTKGIKLLRGARERVRTDGASWCSLSNNHVQCMQRSALPPPSRPLSLCVIVIG